MCSVIFWPCSVGVFFRDQEGRSQNNIRMLRLAVCASLMSLIGIAISITLSAVQDFDCKVSRDASQYHADADGLQDVMGSGLGRHQRSLEPPIPGASTGHLLNQYVFQ